MFGALDIDSLQFETRLLLKRVRTLTGESEDDAIRRALEERYLRLTSPTTTQNPPGETSGGAAGDETLKRDGVRILR